MSEQPAEAQTAPTSRWTYAAIASVALAVIAVTLLGVVMQRVGSQTRTINRADKQAAASSLNGPAARSVIAAAKTGITATLSYNYKTLPADMARAERSMAPAFKTTYVQTMQRQVIPLASKTQTSTTASVPEVGVKSVSPTTATVLAFADQVVRNNQLSTDGRLDRTRIEADLVLVDGHWLISKLRPL
jgi:Mce-associated membrane protein